MYVINDIIRINIILSNYFKEDVYNLFLDGYCLEYYNILKMLYPSGKMVLEKDHDHCAILIDNNIYDVSGFRSKDDFVLASKTDENFVNSFYNKFSEENKKKIYKIISGYAKEKQNN